MILTSALIVVIIITIACAGCSSKDKTVSTGGAGQASSGASLAPAGAAAPAAAGGNCPAVDAAHSWNGKWETALRARRDLDGRWCFNNPKPEPGQATNWESCMNNGFNAELTQTGCDVTGKMIKTDTSQCPVTLMGKVDGTNLKGTWKAYCNMGTYMDLDERNEDGTFAIWMDPDGSAFAGAFDGSSPAALKTTAEAVKAGENSNFVGKRA